MYFLQPKKRHFLMYKIVKSAVDLTPMEPSSLQLQWSNKVMKKTAINAFFCYGIGGWGLERKAKYFSHYIFCIRVVEIVSSTYKFVARKGQK